jgi:hypothetical protein
MAPANPSGTDQSVAAAAASAELKAQQEVMEKNKSAGTGVPESADNNPAELQIKDKKPVLFVFTKTAATAYSPNPFFLTNKNSTEFAEVTIDFSA